MALVGAMALLSSWSAQANPTVFVAAIDAPEHLKDSAEGLNQALCLAIREWAGRRIPGANQDPNAVMCADEVRQEMSYLAELQAAGQGDVLMASPAESVEEARIIFGAEIISAPATKKLPARRVLIITRMDRTDLQDPEIRHTRWWIRNGTGRTFARRIPGMIKKLDKAQKR
jgi:hypothetical protein